MSQCRSSSKLSKSLIAFTVVEPPCSCSPHLATSLITGACQKSNPIVFLRFKKVFLRFKKSISQVQTAKPRQLRELLLLSSLCRFFQSSSYALLCSEMAAQGRRSRYRMISPMMIEDGGAIRLRAQCMVMSIIRDRLIL